MSLYKFSFCVNIFVVLFQNKTFFVVLSLLIWPLYSFNSTTYNVSVTGLGVGNSLMNVGFSALVDSGTSFTYLADPAYTSLSKSVSNSKKWVT